MNLLVPLPVILPLFGAGAALMLSRRPGAQRLISFSVLTAVVAIAAVLLVRADRYGPRSRGSAPGPRRWASAWSPIGCLR